MKSALLKTHNEIMNVFCSIKDWRTVAKGIEIDVGADIIIDGLTVWECCYTFGFLSKEISPHLMTAASTFTAGKTRNHVSVAE